ncbi:hypothetical protein B484DRAFT_421450 [Ochromonadaceae sp. CCMP2298]|nr:hypothetical protein B484DRAFT_421450 [Ochromonadaceae sp. CCMP2298]
MQPYEVQVKFKTEDRDEKNKIPVSHAGDVFMLGLVLGFIFTGFDPFSDDDEIFKKKEPDLGSLASEQPWLHHLLKCMTSHDCETRPSIDLVLRHPYFASFEQNEDNLHKKIENVLVAGWRSQSTDRGPVDNAAFRKLEKMEVEAGAGRPVPVLAPPVRNYPLPLTAQFVKWLRNTLEHFHEDSQQQDNLRRSKSTVRGEEEEGAFYATAGEFFIRHPVGRGGAEAEEGVVVGEPAAFRRAHGLMAVPAFAPC